MRVAEMLTGRCPQLRQVALLMAAAALLCAPAIAGAQGLSDRFAADPDAGQAALALARRAFDTWCLQRQRIPPPVELPSLLRERSGVYVSAILGDAPRCCMGTLYPTRPTLAEEIINAAVAAAGMDLRFPPITPPELTQVRLIVSVVDPPERLADPRALDPATEGVAVRCASGWGVSLPGETPHRELLVEWARIRAGAVEGEPVELYRVIAYRVIEPQTVSH